MIVTITEFKTNLDKYLDLVENEDILIINNGSIIAQLSIPDAKKLSAIQSLVGLTDNGTEVDVDELKAERLSKQ